MKKKYSLVNTNELKTHEKISIIKFKQIKKQMLKDGYLRNPVVVDKKTKVVLDGHHRLAVFKSLQINKIPVCFVNYMSNQIRVFPRRQKIFQNILKKEIINCGINGYLFPHKTTKHFIKMRIKNINFKLLEK